MRPHGMTADILFTRYRCLVDGHLVVVLQKIQQDQTHQTLAERRGATGQRLRGTSGAGIQHHGRRAGA